jgi:sugar transferase EpsL
MNSPFMAANTSHVRGPRRGSFTLATRATLSYQGFVRQRGFSLLAKRFLDVSFAGAALAATLPVIGAAAGAVVVTMGRPVFFRQARPGRNGRIFHVWKFRTMNDARDARGRLLSDAERLTPVGELLRSSSVDELPQLFNVLGGDMSLVGPRPLLPQYLTRYSTEQARRHEVLPGITGWAQINGRNNVTWPEKLALDVWYVDHWTPWLDLEILVKTIVSVLRREGISREGYATTVEFMGNDEVRA